MSRTVGLICSRFAYFLRDYSTDGLDDSPFKLTGSPHVNEPDIYSRTTRSSKNLELMTGMLHEYTSPAPRFRSQRTITWRLHVVDPV